MKSAITLVSSGTLISLTLLVVLAFAGGCQHKADGVPMSSSVTEISTPPAYTPAPAANYAPVQPVYDSTPTAASSTYAGTSSNAIAGGGTYTIKKGDTLFGIARARYGDGKQWQKIAAANQGLSPQSLKVGQTITVP